jgi:hypothetical protein
MEQWYMLYHDSPVEELESTLKYMQRDITLAELAPDVPLSEKLSYIKEMRAGVKVVRNLLERKAS